MRNIRNRFWIPSIMILFSLVVAPVVAQETSEEKNVKKNVVVKAEVVDGNVVITDGDGNVRIIKIGEGDGKLEWHTHGDSQDGNTSDRRVIVLKQGEAGHLDGGHGTLVWKQESADQKGEAGAIVRSRAILIGPDGKQEVILDGNGENSFELRMVPDEEGLYMLETLHDMSADDLLGQLSALTGQGFMIGVSCEPIGDTMKAQLGIEHGLVVASVVDKSPSAGNIEAHDILVKAGNVVLNDVQQLVEAVQEAGENEAELELTLIRKGKEISVSLTPVKREASELPGLLTAEGIHLNLQDLQGDLKFVDGVTLESFGPGLIDLKARLNEDTGELTVEIEKLKKEVEELREKLKGDK